MKGLLSIICAVVADVATLGGAVNEGWFKNGRCTYTEKAIRKLKKKSP